MAHPRPQRLGHAFAAFAKGGTATPGVEFLGLEVVTARGQTEAVISLAHAAGGTAGLT